MIYLCIFCAVMCVVSYICSKEHIFAPAVTVSGIWFICTFLYFPFASADTVISSKFTLNMGLWVGCFALGALTMQSLRFSAPFKDILPSNTARNIYFYITLLTLPILAFDVFLIIQQSSGGNIFSTLRTINISGHDQIGRTSAPFVAIWLVAYTMELLCYSKENRWRVYFLFFANCFYAFISMGKNSFLTLFIITILILYFQSKIKIRTILFGLVILFIAFLALQTIRNKSSQHLKTEQFITLYMLSGIPAFDQFVEPHSGEYWGEYTFRFFYAIPYKLGLSSIEPTNPISDFVYVTIKDVVYPTNVYTVLYQFYKDFGTMGVIVFGLLLGALFGWLYKLSQQKDYFAMTLYVLFFFCLVIQFMSEVFLGLLSEKIQYALIALIPFIISKYHLFEKRKHA